MHKHADYYSKNLSSPPTRKTTMNLEELAKKLDDLVARIDKEKYILTKQTYNELEVLLDKIVALSRGYNSKSLNEAAKYAISALHNLDDHNDLRRTLSKQTKNQITAATSFLQQAKEDLKKARN